MSRRAANFSKSDLSRAMKVARENGMTVEVTSNGTIKIVPDGSTGIEIPLAQKAVESF
jgi:hypothetical protein